MTKEEFVEEFLKLSLPRGFFPSYDEATGRCVVTFQIRDMTCVPDPVPDYYFAPRQCADHSVSLIADTVHELVPQDETERLR